VGSGNRVLGRHGGADVMGAGRVSRTTCNVSAERSSMFRGFVGKLLGTAGVAEAALSDVWCAGVLELHAVEKGEAERARGSRPEMCLATGDGLGAQTEDIGMSKSK
jgi:hypothetical protein